MKSSTDGVYVWLDDDNKFCNEKLAKMFGYTAAEWKKSKIFLEQFVHEDDREMFAENFSRSVAALAHPVTFRFRGKRKDGSYIRAETDMIPLTFNGHAMAYHFVRELK